MKLYQNNALVNEILSNSGNDFTKVSFPDNHDYSYLMTVHYFVKQDRLFCYKENKAVPGLSLEYEYALDSFCRDIMEKIYNADIKESLSSLLASSCELTPNDDGLYYFIDNGNGLRYIFVVDPLQRSNRNFYLYLYG